MAMLLAIGISCSDQKKKQISNVPIYSGTISAANSEVIQVRIDFTSGSVFGKHNHPDEEIIYVLDGSLEYQIENKTPVTVKAGDVLFIYTGTMNSARNISENSAAELATYVVEKGKPLLVMAR